MMPGADHVSTRIGYPARTGSWPTDLIIAAVFLAVYALVIHAFQYQGALGESDLYRVLVGIMAGADSGEGLATDLHYDRDFGFGYLAAFYAFADPSTLRDPDRLMALMNQVGFWSALAGFALFWCAVRLVHGSLTATVALIVFALAPMIPELATSGHQVLPMFAFLCAAAFLMFLPLTGRRAVLAGVAAWALLLLGMTMRGEEFLAFPWLVLARADTASFRRFIISALLRSIAPALAIVGWAVLQRIVLPAASNEMGSTISLYFAEFYRWRTIAPGVVYMMTGCGFATVAVAAGAIVYLGWQDLAGRRIAPAAGLGARLGPAALVLVPFLFFVPNPQPTRHFMLTLAGLGIFIGMAFARFPRAGRATAIVGALCIGAANQVFAELVRPPLLRINEAGSPYRPVPTSYPTTTHANLGWEWRRHAALAERRARWQAFAEEIRATCDSHLIVLSDEGEQLFSRLYEGGTQVEAERTRIVFDPRLMPNTEGARENLHVAWVGGGEPRLVGLKGIVHGKTFLVIDKSHLWPGDAVAIILATPAYNGYKLISDPYTMSTFDRTPVPPDRRPTFGCQP